jgi:hypothetical protein
MCGWPDEWLLAGRVGACAVPGRVQSGRCPLHHRSPATPPVTRALARQRGVFHCTDVLCAAPFLTRSPLSRTRTNEQEAMKAFKAGDPEYSKAVHEQLAQVEEHDKYGEFLKVRRWCVCTCPVCACACVYTRACVYTVYM